MNTYPHFKNLAIAIMVLGTIHVAATSMVASMFRMLDAKSLLTFIFMFVSTGLAMVFVGWLQYFLLKNGIKTLHERRIMNVSVAFIVLIGVGSVATMWNNPFAYISLLLALCQVIIVSKTQHTIEITA